jgi:hypothetical protein
MTLAEFNREHRRHMTRVELDRAIAWFNAHGISADEFVAETNRILAKEQEDLINAIEKISK